MKTVFDRIKNMDFEEMKTFLYWVYKNGVLDGQYGHEDSPYTSYFGGFLLECEADEIPENINELWDLYEECKKNYQSI